MKSLTLLLVAFCFLACSSKTTLNGEVFVATQGGQSVKLGAVPVHIFREEKAKPLADTVFDHLDKADFSTTTDADGKFSVKVPEGFYIVVAQADRRTFDGTDHYKWKVLVSAAGPDKKVSLNNTNLFAF